MENITMLTDNSNFTFENIQKNKNLIIQDEFEYQKKHRGNLLKMLDNAPMAVNVKNKRSNIQTHNAPIIFLGNPTTNNATMLGDAAFGKRLDVYEFSEELEITPAEVAQIKKEEAKIILYCNKLYQRQKRNVNKVHITKQEKLDIIKQIGGTEKNGG